MKKIVMLILITILALSFSSFATSEALPNNYLIIGGGVVELNFAMAHQDDFNQILSDFIANGGQVTQLYVVIGGKMADVYGKGRTDIEKEKILLSCKTIIDAQSPDGRPIGQLPPGELEVISIE